MTINHQAESLAEELVVKVVKSVFQGKNTFTARLLTETYHIADELVLTVLELLETSPEDFPYTDCLADWGTNPDGKVRTADGNENRGKVPNSFNGTSG